MTNMFVFDEALWFFYTNKLLSSVTAGSVISGFSKTAQLLQLVMAVIHYDVCYGDNESC